MEERTGALTARARAVESFPEVALGNLLYKWDMTVRSITARGNKHRVLANAYRTERTQIDTDRRPEILGVCGNALR